MEQELYEIRYLVAMAHARSLQLLRTVPRAKMTRDLRFALRSACDSLHRSVMHLLAFAEIAKIIKPKQVAPTVKIGRARKVVSSARARKK
jgi:hypothetical protein